MRLTTGSVAPDHGRVSTADVIVIGAGVQGASLAFHLTERGASVLVLERESVAAGASGRSSGFVRMHYDLEAEVRLAWASFPYFWDWPARVGAGDPGFVRTGFLQLVPPGFEDDLRANVTMQQELGVATFLLDEDDLRRLVPDLALDDVLVAAYEPLSGYADPAATAAGFLTAARDRGARYQAGCRVERIATASPASPRTGGASLPRSSSTLPVHGPGALPPTWGSRSPSRRGATTPSSSAARAASAPPSRSSSTMPSASTSDRKGAASSSSASRTRTGPAATRTGPSRQPPLRRRRSPWNA